MSQNVKAAQKKRFISWFSRWFNIIGYDALFFIDVYIFLDFFFRWMCVFFVCVCTGVYCIVYWYLCVKWGLGEMLMTLILKIWKHLKSLFYRSHTFLCTILENTVQKQNKQIQMETNQQTNAEDIYTILSILLGIAKYLYQVAFWSPVVEYFTLRLILRDETFNEQQSFRATWKNVLRQVRIDHMKLMIKNSHSILCFHYWQYIYICIYIFIYPSICFMSAVFFYVFWSFFLPLQGTERHNMTQDTHGGSSLSRGPYYSHRAWIRVHVQVCTWWASVLWKKKWYPVDFVRGKHFCPLAPRQPTTLPLLQIHRSHHPISAITACPHFLGWWEVSGMPFVSIIHAHEESW